MKRITSLGMLLIFCYLNFQSLTGCQKRVVTDFGNNAAISGFLKDQNGNIVAGDVTANDMTVKLLGEGDFGDGATIVLPVDGGGKFQNVRLYPMKYSIWVSGPMTMTNDTIHVDLSSNKVTNQDIIVTPFITTSKPNVIGSPTDKVDISYKMNANSGRTVSKRELYCSTSAYPNASRGSGQTWNTITIPLNTDSGITSVIGLAPKTEYCIRIGAKANGTSGFNYSDQIKIVTP